MKRTHWPPWHFCSESGWLYSMLVKANHNVTECHSPCWMTIYNRILISFVILVIHHCRQGRLQTTYSPLWVSFAFPQAALTTLEKFENMALFLRLFLPSTLILHENGALRKRSSKRRIYFENEFSFSRGRKTFWPRNFTKTAIPKHKSKITEYCCVFKILRCGVELKTFDAFSE